MTRKQFWDLSQEDKRALRDAQLGVTERHPGLWESMKALPFPRTGQPDPQGLIPLLTVYDPQAKAKLFAVLPCLPDGTLIETDPEGMCEKETASQRAIFRETEPGMYAKMMAQEGE